MNKCACEPEPLSSLSLTVCVWHGCILGRPGVGCTSCVWQCMCVGVLHGWHHSADFTRGEHPLSLRWLKPATEWGGKEKQVSFCNEVENDLGPDWLNESERDLTLVGLAGPFEALPQPVSDPPSQDPQPEGEGVGGCWGECWGVGVGRQRSEAGGGAPIKAFVLSDPHCWKPQHCILLLWWSKEPEYQVLCMCVCIYYIHDVLYVSWNVCGAVFHGLGCSPFIPVKGNLDVQHT